MGKNSPKILVISSVSPTVGPAIIGEQIYQALKEKDLDVDFLTKYPVPGHLEYFWVLKRKSIFNILLNLLNRLRWRFVGGYPKEAGYGFFYSYEKWPPVPSRLVTRAIKKRYDLVVVVFWQGLLGFDTIDKIFNKLHCLFYFFSVDYSQMSGGCHFTGECQRYKTGCGMCPALHSTNPNDFTAYNVKFRERVYKKVNPIVGGNLYMSEFYKKSLLLNNARIEISSGPIINTEIFRPLDKTILRKKYKIAENKKHVIFFGSQYLNDERKGIKYLLEAFDYLYQMMKEDSRQVLVITAGNRYEEIKESIPFESKGYGYVPMNELPKLFSLSTLFVCPSVNDAGPMMVNQSLCCGTPVVGFDMGAVRQVVKDKGTGVCVPLRDSKALAEGMLKIMQKSCDDYKKMSKKARMIALQTSSFDAKAEFILSIYMKYKDSDSPNSTKIIY